MERLRLLDPFLSASTHSLRLARILNIRLLLPTQTLLPDQLLITRRPDDTQHVIHHEADGETEQPAQTAQLRRGLGDVGAQRAYEPGEGQGDAAEVGGDALNVPSFDVAVVLVQRRAVVQVLREDVAFGGSQKDGKARRGGPVPVEDCGEEIPWIPERQSPGVVDCCGGEDTECSRQGHTERRDDHLRELCCRARLAPPGNVGLVGDERGDGAYICASVDHAEDEEAEDGGQDNDGLEPEEGAQLVGSQGAEGEVDEPEEEKGEHALAGDADGGRDVVGDVSEVVTEDGSKDVIHEAGSRVYCFANVVDTGAPAVEIHGRRADELADEDDEDALPPVETDADHGAAQGPVAKGQPQVEGHVVPPGPCTVLLGSDGEVFIGPGVALVVGGIVGADPAVEVFAGGEGGLEVVELDEGLVSKTGGAHFEIFFFFFLLSPSLPSVFSSSSLIEYF
ncbi:hypothetical protein B7463_g1676, partial [Scytalidium lignicola]